MSELRERLPCARTRLLTRADEREHEYDGLFLLNSASSYALTVGSCAFSAICVMQKVLPTEVGKSRGTNNFPSLAAARMVCSGA